MSLVQNITLEKMALKVLLVMLTSLWPPCNRDKGKNAPEFSM